MSAPRHILLVTNSTTEAEIAEIKQVMSAPAEKKLFNIKLSLVHVIPPLPTCYFNIPSMVMLAERYYEEAKQSLACIGDMLSILQHDQWLITGKPRSEVLRLANRLNTHFILASSTIIPELHKSFLFRKEHKTPIKNINQLSMSDVNT
jgi:hypothetical protein